jgi:histone H1/5
MTIYLRTRMHERWPRGLMLAAICAWIVLPASPSFATEIVEVRVGRHAEFTRVVFELDRPAGYRVEKDRESGALTVTFDAASAPRTIEARDGAISTVEVSPAGRASVARIAVRETGLRLQEMILANPPRIVLDVMHAPVAVAKKPAATKPAPVEPAPPKPVAEKPATTPAPETVAKEPAPPKTVEKPGPATKPVEGPTAAAKPAAKKPVAETPPADPDAIAKALGDALQAAAEGARDDETAKPQIGGEAAAPVVAKSDPSAKPVAPKPGPVAKPVVTRAKPIPNSRSVAKTPPAPTTTDRPAAGGTDSEATAGGLSPIALGAGAGILLCAVGLIVMLRRRRPSKDLDDEGDEASASDAEPSFSESVFGEATAETPAVASGSGATDLDSFFDDDDDAKMNPETKGDEAMDQGISDLPADPDFGGLPPAPVAPVAGPDPDVLRVVHELERRMAQLEGKLGEATEARERLERQVAAQSEELRVQRAAIARTQRALRTLSRGEEEKATEPALRDDAQAKTRINV